MPIDHLTPIVADIYRVVSYDVNGVPAFGNYSRIRARVELTDEQIRDEKEQMVRINARLFTQPLIELNINDRVICSGINYKVVKGRALRDITGRFDHTEAMLAEE